MQKRSEINKKEKMLFRTKLRRTLMVALCLLFAYSAIYAADISNKRMLNKQDEDSYAMRASLEERDMLRIDLAGVKHYYDISNIKLYAHKLSEETKGIKDKLRLEYENYIKGF